MSLRLLSRFKPSPHEMSRGNAKEILLVLRIKWNVHDVKSVQVTYLLTMRQCRKRV